MAKLSINSTAGVGLVALAVAGVVVLTGLANVVTSALGAGTGDANPEQRLKALVAKHDGAMQNWQDQFNGRSPFFKPPAPPPPPPPPSPVVDTPPPVVDTKPVIDPVYRGPSINFAYGDTVYFAPLSSGDKFTRLRIGEEKGDLKVISTNLPWSIKVGYKGGEYDVSLFSKTDESAFISNTPKPVMLSSFLVPVADPKESEIPTSTAAAQTGEIPTPPQPNVPRSVAVPANTTRQPIREVGGEKPVVPPGEVGPDDPPPVESPQDDPGIDDENPPQPVQPEGEADPAVVPDPVHEEGEGVAEPVAPPQPEAEPKA